MVRHLKIGTFINTKLDRNDLKLLMGSRILNSLAHNIDSSYLGCRTYLPLSKITINFD